MLSFESQLDECVWPKQTAQKSSTPRTTELPVLALIVRGSAHNIKSYATFLPSPTLYWNTIRNDRLADGFNNCALLQRSLR
jgi:hypothetical protein